MRVLFPRVLFLRVLFPRVLFPQGPFTRVLLVQGPFDPGSFNFEGPLVQGPLAWVLWGRVLLSGVLLPQPEINDAGKNYNFYKILKSLNLKYNRTYYLLSGGGAEHSNGAADVAGHGPN